MKIGLIDVDGHHFPNLPLMKLSAWHQLRGDDVSWYEPLTGGRYDRIYMSKVFTFTPDYLYPLNAGEVIRGGTGYDPSGGTSLPDEIEHSYPDYELYPGLCRNTAYGFLTRGCPRGCAFCIVGGKEGLRSVKVADLSEFRRGQKNIKLLDPNLLACPDHIPLLRQLIDSEATVDFTQGLDARLLTVQNLALLRQVKVKTVHFAWDNYRDRDVIVPRLQWLKDTTGWDRHKVGVYLLTNFSTTFEQDLERVNVVRELGFTPYVMIYNKETLPRGHCLRRLQRWCNGKIIWSEPDFNRYAASKGAES